MEILQIGLKVYECHATVQLDSALLHLAVRLTHISNIERIRLQADSEAPLLTQKLRDKILRIHSTILSLSFCFSLSILLVRIALRRYVRAIRSCLPIWLLGLLRLSCRGFRRYHRS